MPRRSRSLVDERRTITLSYELHNYWKILVPVRPMLKYKMIYNNEVIVLTTALLPIAHLILSISSQVVVRPRA